MYPDALSYPFLVAYDVPHSDDPNLDRERKITAFDRMTAKVPQLWRSRNHDSFAPVVWAAAYARLGITSVANEAVDFAQRHFAGTPEGLLNHEQMWLDTAQKWASGQDWRLV